MPSGSRDAFNPARLELVSQVSAFLRGITTVPGAIFWSRITIPRSTLLGQMAFQRPLHGQGGVPQLIANLWYVDVLHTEFAVCRYCRIQFQNRERRRTLWMVLTQCSRNLGLIIGPLEQQWFHKKYAIGRKSAFGIFWICTVIKQTEHV